MLTFRHLHRWVWISVWLGWFLSRASSAAPHYDPETDRFIPERAPRPWPSNRDVRSGEPGCWKPPSDRFSRHTAVRAVLPAFVAGLDATDRTFGDIPKDVHFDGFVPLTVRAPSTVRRGAIYAPWEVSIVRIGPHDEHDETLSKPTIRTFLLLTSQGKALWKHQLAETTGGAFADHYRLSRVVTQFGKDPMVLLFCDTGGSTRDFMYTLKRVTKAGLEDVWESYPGIDDGHTGSLQQGYSQSHFDFSAMRSGRANEFTVYTTSGCRRAMDPEQVKDLTPVYTKRVYHWNGERGTFVKVKEHAFSK